MIDSQYAAFLEARKPRCAEEALKKNHQCPADYFFLEKNPSIRLAKSSENPNRALAREYRSTAFLSSQINEDFIAPSSGRAR